MGSMVPTATAQVTINWFSRSKFVVVCQMGINGTLVLDEQHCDFNASPWNFESMIPILGSQLVVIYGGMKVLASFMVMLDPFAVGTLSVLHAWQAKMEVKRQTIT